MWSLVVFVAIIAGISATAEVPLATVGENPESRIVSGWESREGQFPYMVYVRGILWTGDITACGASIIHRNFMLSSARCTAQRLLLIINAGSVNRHTPRVQFETGTYYTHPNYIDELHGITQGDDISVIVYKQGFNFNNFIQPIRLQRSADMARDYSRVLMTTTGWGTTFTCVELDCPMPDILNWVHLQGVSNLMCVLLLNSNYLVRPTTVCAGPYNVTSQSICSGDSGVPLTTVESDGVLTQVGIGSFVSPWGCHVGLPGGFTRPGFYHNWIHDVTGFNLDWNRAGAHPALEPFEDSPEKDEFDHLKYI